MRIILVFLLDVGCLALGQECFAANRNPRIEVLVQNADAYGKQGNFAVALQLYEQAIRMSPGDLELYYRRAGVYGDAGHYVKAIKDLNQVINRGGGKFSHAIRFRADCFMALGYYQQAVSDYLAFLRVAPKDGKVWSYLVEAYALMGQKQLALQAVNKGLATQSHWSGKLKKLQVQVMTGQRIKPHKPFSN
ncbi:tetratricopeptide repeat protein [Trichloromonas sp.]|uniref:tetratricopeptide repeat protein n=1 Tax=Trichloromonas sp. TaxID=3069249 RepID=UPI003D81AD15